MPADPQDMVPEDKGPEPPGGPSTAEPGAEPAALQASLGA